MGRGSRPFLTPLSLSTHEEERRRSIVSDSGAQWPRSRNSVERRRTRFFRLMMRLLPLRQRYPCFDVEVRDSPVRKQIGEELGNIDESVFEHFGTVRRHSV